MIPLLRGKYQSIMNMINKWIIYVTIGDTLAKMGTLNGNPKTYPVKQRDIHPTMPMPASH